MTTWTIDALQVGEVRDVASGSLHFGDRSGKLHNIPLIMYVLRSDLATIIVDTGGPPDAGSIRSRDGWHYFTDETQTCAAGLERLGVDAAAVTLVINTHWHWDHCSNNSHFSNARIVVQRAELAYAVQPSPPHLGTYGFFAGSVPPWVDSLSRLRPVEGEKVLADGVRVVPLPGHSPGSQGVVVHTAEGDYVITGDCLDDMDNWEIGPSGDARPSGSFTNLPDFYDSLALLKESGWTPLPSHDPRVVARGTFG